MSSEDIVIDVRNLSKRYEIYNTPRDRLKQFVLPHLYNVAHRTGAALRISKQSSPPRYFREFWAFQNLSFQVRRGETLGIIGLNGSGKSTLLQILAGTLAQTSGEVNVNGRVAALLELGSGFNPEFTGHENVFLNGRILGLSLKEVESRYEQILDFADIGDFIYQPVKTYSSGMTVRLAFSVAANINPEILIVDEALAVGDIAFQRKCISYMESFSREGGILLFVSHSLEQIRRLCKNAIYLKNGSGTIGTAKEMCDAYETDLFGSQVHGRQPGPIVDLVASPGDSLLGKEENAPFEFPECAIHYGNRAANISRCWTTDVYGIRKITFKPGEKIVWCFQVVFEVLCRNVFFGLMIKTKEGINLFGTNTLEMGVALSNAQAGETVLVGFEIDSHLGPGEYFLNCSAAQGDTEDPTFLHRIVDAAIITVGANENCVSGLIAMDVICRIDNQLK